MAFKTKTPTDSTADPRGTYYRNLAAARDAAASPGGAWGQRLFQRNIPPTPVVFQPAVSQDATEGLDTLLQRILGFDSGDSLTDEQQQMYSQIQEALRVFVAKTLDDVGSSWLSGAFSSCADMIADETAYWPTRTIFRFLSGVFANAVVQSSASRPLREITPDSWEAIRTQVMAIVNDLNSLTLPVRAQG